MTRREGEKERRRKVEKERRREGEKKRWREGEKEGIRRERDKQSSSEGEQGKETNQLRYKYLSLYLTV